MSAYSAQGKSLFFQLMKDKKGSVAKTTLQLFRQKRLFVFF
jgi:hypothetical protein